MVPWDRLVYHIVSPGPSLGAAVSPCPLCRTTSPWRWEHSHLVAVVLLAFFHGWLSQLSFYFPWRVP